MRDDFQDDSARLAPQRKRGGVAGPVVALLAVLMALGAGYYAWHLRNEEQGSRATLAKLTSDNKSLSDALELLRASSGDLGGKLTTCKEELTTQTSSAEEADKRRTTVETELAACQLSVKDLKAESREQKALLAEFKGLTGKFQRMIDSGKLDVAFRRGNMVVKLPASILFPSGSADLSEGGRAAIGEVAAILKQMTGRRFTVAGHTDNIPVGNGPFKDNWELSALRAVKVTSLLINKGVPAPNLVAAGYGEHDPIASNATGSGRQKNRRIEIILEPNLKQVPAKALLQKPAPTAKGKAKPPAKPKPKSGP